jgi:ADP-ribose pyrophosphatase YjhB (NUDIX family)
MSWQRLNRKTLVDHKFLQVYADHVKLPNGTEIEDYTVVKLNDTVHIVATDEQNNLIAMREYKYAVNATLLVVPAGNIEKGEDPVTTARRELEEEAGYVGGEFSVVAKLCEYPTKNMHTATVVRARNVRLNGKMAREATEQIENIELIPLADVKARLKHGDFTMTATIADLTLALPELFLK